MSKRAATDVDADMSSSLKKSGEENKQKSHFDKSEFLRQ
jgi:hypothetical protein